MADEDERAAALARAIKEASEQLDLPAQRQMRELEAKTAKARFDQLVKAGFTEAQALQLCHQPVRFS